MEETRMDRRRAVRELRHYFRRRAQHPHDCICACCEAVEVLALRAESNADFDVREAEDMAEDRHLRSLEGE